MHENKVTFHRVDTKAEEQKVFVTEMYRDSYFKPITRNPALDAIVQRNKLKKKEDRLEESRLVKEFYFASRNKAMAEREAKRKPVHSSERSSI